MFKKNLLESRNGRLTTFGLLYISEGIPYGFTSIAMVTYLRQSGLPLDQIGIFAATLFIPWSFKFAWAPVIDIVKLNAIGGRKAWITICLLFMISTLLLVASFDFRNQFDLLLLLILVNNIFCATQDVAIDSLAVTTLKPDERARGNGFMFGGQYTGIALGGGSAIYIFGQYSFNIALIYVSVLQVLCLLFVLLFVKDPRASQSPSSTVSAESVLRKFVITLKDFVIDVYVSFWRSGKSPQVAFLFSVLPVGALVMAYAALSTIQVDYGFDETQIAKITTMNTIMGALGCIVGGLLADRFGLRKMLVIFYIISTIPGLFLASQISLSSLTELPAIYVSGTIVVHGFLYGLCFGTHAAIFMGITNPKVAATQFTAFMAMGNLVVTYTNFWQGAVAERFDYALVLYIDAALVIFPVLLIPFLKSREEVQLQPVATS